MMKIIKSFLTVLLFVPIATIASPSILQTKQFIVLYSLRTISGHTETNCTLRYKSERNKDAEVDFSLINPTTVRSDYIGEDWSATRELASRISFDHDPANPGCFIYKNDEAIPFRKSSCAKLLVKKDGGEKVVKAIKHAAKLCGAKGVSADLFN